MEAQRREHLTLPSPEDSKARSVAATIYQTLKTQLVSLMGSLDHMLTVYLYSKMWLAFGYSLGLLAALTHMFFYNKNQVNEN